MLREMAAALDAMPIKELIAGHLVIPESGKCCALGALLLAKGVWKPWRLKDDRDAVAAILDVDADLVSTIEDINDESPGPETDAQRWTRVRAWVGRRSND